MVITNNGNVGIGTTAPQAALHVNNNIQIFMNNTKSTTIIKSGDISANSSLNVTINTVDYGFTTSKGVIMVEITAGVYGSGGTGSGVFKCIYSCYPDHNYTSQGSTIVALNTYVNNMTTYGSFTALNNSNGIYGVTISNTHPTSVKSYVVSWTITS